MHGIRNSGMYILLVGMTITLGLLKCHAVKQASYVHQTCPLTPLVVMATTYTSGHTNCIDVSIIIQRFPFVT